MRAEFVPSPPTISDQIRIGFCKPPGNKNRGLKLSSIAEIQQAFQTDFGSGNPVNIDGEVPGHVSRWTDAMPHVEINPEALGEFGTESGG
jgi:hypothetical protein